MDFLDYAIDVLRFDADFKHAKLFLVLTFIVALIPLVVTGVAGRNKDSEPRFKLRWVLFCSVLLHALSNLLVFLYIFSRPDDPRWAPEQQGVNLPGVDSPEVSRLPFGNDEVNDFLGSVTGGLNSTVNAVEDQLNVQLEPIFDLNAYRLAFDAGSDFFLYSVLGFVTLLVLFTPILWLGHRADVKKEKQQEQEESARRDAELDEERARRIWTERQLVELTGGAFITYDQHTARVEENEAAYWRQVEEAGHTEVNCWPITPEVDYVNNPHAYKEDADRQYRAQKQSSA